MTQPRGHGKPGASPAAIDSSAQTDMAMNSQRKILCVVAGLAAAAVAVDRTLLSGSTGGPQTADASVASSAADAAPPALPATTGPAASTPADPLAIPGLAGPAGPAGPTLAQRLDRVRDALPPEAPDAFVATAFWHTPTAAPTPAPTAPPAASFDPRLFAHQHPLHAIYSEAGQARAMIDGKALRVGDVCDGVTLQAIDERSVVWAGPGVRFRVTLDGRRR